MRVSEWLGFFLAAALILAIVSYAKLFLAVAVLIYPTFRIFEDIDSDDALGAVVYLLFFKVIYYPALLFALLWFAEDVSYAIDSFRELLGVIVILLIIYAWASSILLSVAEAGHRQLVYLLTLILVLPLFEVGIMWLAFSRALLHNSR